ncbi:aldehyde dehydrogenase family protein [Ureibacillus sp. GCM10028918]|uniref:aldehyde dehydrogenase family protein n=1 Tax=Ureibacillus sp. GCM10028918 TaxID=3273429 RepID=UPI003620B31D
MKVLFQEATVNLLKNVQDELGAVHQFIGGAYITGEKTGDVIFPYDGQPIFTFYKSSTQDVEEAISLAEKALPSMKKLTLYERAEILSKTANILEEHIDSIAKIIVYETSKTLKDAIGEVTRAISTFRFSAEATKSLHGETLPLDAMSGVGKRLSFIVHEPIGVVGAITGFNFPILLAAHKLGPAFGAGNTVVLKPSPGTPISSIVLAWVLQQAGLPMGALSVVNGDVEVGEAIVKDPRIAVISFTGSSLIGRKISQQAEYKKVLLELGSNAATIIDSVENLEEVAEKLVTGGYGANGQSCISVQRIIVNKQLSCELTEILKNKVSLLKVGNPFDKETNVSALFTQNANQRITEWIEEALHSGAKLEVGGKIENQIFLPTLLSNVSSEMRVFKEEIFGPVILVTTYESFDEAIELVNDSRYGLQVGVYTTNLPHALKAIDEIKAGSVHINEISNFRPDHMPYGGYKESGIGKEGPQSVLDELTNKKVVSFKL